MFTFAFIGSLVGLIAWLLPIILIIVVLSTIFDTQARVKNIEKLLSEKKGKDK